MPQRIFLVGPMGAGKTTVGKQLAKLLNLAFIDLDAEIESRCGADIQWIFDVEGEEGFRRRESSILSEVAAQDRIVIATGGGAVLRPENRALLKKSGTVIYLSIPAEALYQRTLRDTKRPLLQVEDRRAVIERLIAEREPFYQEVADIIYDGVNANPQASANALISLIQDGRG
ncbi:MAG TPA: shikimate kinase AroK [Porticoccaceae bacterium]|nr:shikimate kinase AroK [Porticoccaceae bacterium]HCO60296.1 shikimate kinase AroK [Porticoccaceae bacterium]